MTGKRGIVAFWAVGLAWLPLLILCLLDGTVLDGSVAVPFLQDLEVHVRLLVALPLLIVAEFVTMTRVRLIPQMFLERDLIPDDAKVRFASAMNSSTRIHDSMTAELFLIAFVYTVGTYLWRQYVAADANSWYGTPGVDGLTLSYAGAWYAWVSLPIFQFILCRWYFRLFIWARYLWQISGIDLKLVPTHPDRLGGLGFLPNTTLVLAAFAFAHGVLLAGYLATRILVLGTPFLEFKVEIALMVGIMLCVVLGPLLTFMPQLYAARRRGLRDYGRLSMRYVADFDAKWLRSTDVDHGSLMGSADIQSLADLANSYNVVKAMRTTPITSDAIIRVTAATLAPIVPLLLTMMPFEQLARKLLAMLF